ncbi:unnamed protein product, partial [Coregonus sp. 'balchen']
NVVILVLLAVAFLIIVQRNLLNLNDFLISENPDAVPGMLLPFESEFSPELRPDLVRTGEKIPVVITAAEERLGAVVAAMNSVYQNSKANIVFNIVTMNDTVDHLKVWMSKTQLNNVKHKIIIFEPQLLNGKITKDPQKLDLKSGHAAAFSDDCDSASAKGIVRGAGNQNNYIGFLDFKKEAIKKLGMRANTCSFNPGVIVANLTEWKRQNITNQLEHWMELNAQEDLYSKTLAESITTPPLLIVFYKHHSSIDPMWHVRHLGATGAGNRYSPQFVKAAKLLHWNGHYKPWSRTSSFTEVWDKWYIQDPMRKFHPVRKHAGDK